MVCFGLVESDDQVKDKRELDKRVDGTGSGQEKDEEMEKSLLE